MDDSLSSTKYNKSFHPFPKCEFSSENSGWSLYIDTSIDGSSIACSSFCSNPGSSAIFSAPITHIAKKRKTKTAVVDHDLEDTASSPISTSKFQESDNMYMKSQALDHGLNILVPAQIGELDYVKYSKEKINATIQTEEVMNLSFKLKDMSRTKLREKGLCLIPVSMLFNFP